MQVKSLIAECKSFADKDVTPFSNLVSKLDSVYQALAGGRRSPKGSIADKRSVSMDPEAAKRDYTKPISRAFSIDVGGQRSFSDGTEDPKVLQEVCTLHSTLESKWGAFEKDFKRYSTKMDLSLKFNEVIFEVSVCVCVCVCMCVQRRSDICVHESLQVQCIDVIAVT